MLGLGGGLPGGPDRAVPAVQDGRRVAGQRLGGRGGGDAARVRSKSWTPSWVSSCRICLVRVGWERDNRAAAAVS
ncbi:hypothetical protein ACFQ0T_05425 [Kitasatospora gansuensis]